MTGADADFTAGLILQRENRLDDAESAYRRSLCLFPANGDAWHNLSIIVFHRDDFQFSIKTFEKACRSDVQSIGNRVSYVHAASSCGEVSLAMQAIRNFREEAFLSEPLISKHVARMESTIEAVAVDRASKFFVCGNYSALLNSCRRWSVCFPENGFFWRALGLANFKLGNSSAARTSLATAITLWPYDFEAFLNRCAVFLDLGLIDEAQFDAGRAVSLRPESALAINNLGVVAEMRDLGGRFLKYSEIACALDPYSVPNLCRLAMLFQEQHQASKAEKLLSKSLCIEPENSEVLANIGMWNHQARRSVIAVKMLRRAIASQFNNVNALALMAATISDSARSETDRRESHAFFQFAMALNPADAEINNNYGILLVRSGQSNEAFKTLVRASQLVPSYSDPRCNLGMIHQARGEIGVACLLYQKSLVLRPGNADAVNNLGSVSWVRGESDLAILHFERALSIDSDFLDAAHNRCKALHGMLRLEEAIDGYSALLCRCPDLFEAYWHQSLAFLAKGKFERGWRFYEYRWLLDQSKVIGVRGPVDTIWIGGKIPSQMRLLVYHEQGLGDTLQFCRYIKLLVAQGVSVITRVPDTLSRLLRGQEGYGTVVGFSDPVPPFDLHCPMMSLPLAFKTTLESIPFSEGSYLRELPADVVRWGARLDRVFGEPEGGCRRLRVGVVWNGGFRPEQPALWEANQRRNIPLGLFAKHLNIPGIDFVSLQKGDPAESELRGKETEYWRGGRIFNVGDSLGDFADTAGVISNLDLIISVDTSTAHLSAAMGKRTWILNRFDTCWRWLTDRPDSPWYRSVTLYRQGPEQDWAGVLSRVASDLSMLRDQRSSK